jgi:DNA-binding transcriptional ArsR family regulator
MHDSLRTPDFRRAVAFQAEDPKKAIAYASSNTYTIAMGRVAASQDAFRAIADPRRRQMLDAMLQAEQSVTDLTQLTGIRQSSVSQHLDVLRKAGLVEERQAGRNRFYAVRAGQLAVVAEWLDKYERFWAERLDALTRHLSRGGH